MNEWNIQSRAQACAACGQAFADGQAYHTLLFDEKAGLRRSDVCEACWQRQTGAGAPREAGFVSHWQGVFEVPPPVVEVIQKATAETLLRQLLEQNDPRHAPAAFILAVMLERKRLLKVKETLQRDGRRVFVYEHPGQGDLFTITDPELRLDELQQVQQDVAALLEHGLNPAPAADAGAVPMPAPMPTTADGASDPAPAESPAAPETAAG